MIQLGSKILGAADQLVLDALQGQINSETTFEKRVEKAQSLWDSKKGSKKNRAAFENITTSLKEMCVSTGICNYCEQNEASDIEHIHPKSFFPENTFDWENYILACKQCNTGFKLDKGFVLDEQDELVALERSVAPPFSRIAFINIRKHNPEDFMILNSASYTFMPLDGLSREQENTAKATLAILELNERDTLIAARKSAARYFYYQLNELINILATEDIISLEQILSPNDDRFDFSQPLQQIKEEIQNSYRTFIQSYPHPSVWSMIKQVLSKTHPKWKSLFDKLPEALSW